MTRKMLLIAGVAGLALTSPASADRGGRGGGGGEQRAQAQQQRAERPQRQQAQRAERPQMQRAERPQMQRMERPQMQRQQMQRAERPQMQRMERPQMQRQQVQRAERAQRIERAQRPQQRIERQVQRVERQRPQQRIERQAQRVERQRPQRIERQAQRIERRVEQRADFRNLRDQRRALIANADNRPAFRARAEARANGMPFRYGVHDMRDMKPMKAINSPRYDRIVSVGEKFNRIGATAAVPTYFASRYVDTPQYYYRYDNDLGYVYRINRYDQRVNSLIPLFGGYGAGDPWPMTYRSSYVPLGYQNLYYDTPDYYYRYDGNGIYRIDAQTQLISGLVALLAGNSLGIGQMLPSNYGVYNVPLAYRSSYYDTNDAWYRYGDGFIYQVDPYSRRIEQRYPLYAGYDDYMIGSQWPVAYPDYNVPYGYQSVYYDTPQYQYRYANDRIYQVDPTSQLITAVVALLSGNNFNIGQPLPAGYGTYNVPFAYRDRYYDTADDWYRYNNGYVYRVDPRSGLIEDSYPVYA